MTFAASSQNMLEVHMSTIYHKGGKSLPLPNPLYSVRNEMIMAPNKTMAPFNTKDDIDFVNTPNIIQTLEIHWERKEMAS